ncbi:MAG: hypothetical protein R6U98_24755, partial [Pirellulaceae bacterium]
MYSVTFALTVILVIAATHLFLGFAAAILTGYGPKRLSDIKLVVVPLHVSLARWPWACPSKPTLVNQQSDEPGDQETANESTADEIQSTREADKPCVAKTPGKIVLASQTRRANRPDG